MGNVLIVEAFWWNALSQRNKTKPFHKRLHKNETSTWDSFIRCQCLISYFYMHIYTSMTCRSLFAYMHVSMYVGCVCLHACTCTYYTSCRYIRQVFDPRYSVKHAVCNHIRCYPILLPKQKGCLQPGQRGGEPKIKAPKWGFASRFFQSLLYITIISVPPQSPPQETALPNRNYIFIWT